MPGRGRRRQRRPQRLRAPRRGPGPRRGRGRRRGGGARRRPGPVRRRAVRGEGPRRLRRHAHDPRLARLQGPRPGGGGLDPRRPAAAAGGVPIGKTAAPEFGTLNFTKTKAWGITRNPWNPSRTPGGSSGGSAAAVAAGLVPVATASDGGGSTRIPAGFSGLVGLKPSHGRIPHPGPSGSQTAVHGMLTTTVADSARHLDVTAGPHDDDRLSLPAAACATRTLIETLAVAGLRARWSVDLGFVRRSTPRWPASPRRPRPRWWRRRGSSSTARTSTSPTRSDLARGGALDLWFSIDEDMWPGVADDLTRYSRDSSSRRRTTRCRSTPARCGVASSSPSMPPGSSARSTCCSRRPPRCPPSPPRARRPAAPWPRRSRCWPTSAGTRPCRCPPASPSDGLPVGLQITVPRHRDELALRLARIFEQPAPGPGTPPDRHPSVDADARYAVSTRPQNAGSLLAQEALDLFGDGVGAGEDAGLDVVALLERLRRRWRSPRRRRPARSPGARRRPTRSRGRWWGPTSAASRRPARPAPGPPSGDGAPGT